MKQSLEYNAPSIGRMCWTLPECVYTKDCNGGSCDPYPHGLKGMCTQKGSGLGLKIFAEHLLLAVLQV